MFNKLIDLEMKSTFYKIKKDLGNFYENILRSVAICCISTGVFNFSNKRAAEISVNTVENWLSNHKSSIDRVIFNVFKEEDRAYYEELLR